MQLERRHEPLLPYSAFLLRLGRSVLAGVVIVAGSLGIGVVGYHWSGHLSWIDSLYNASMILGGMGPVDDRGLGIPFAEKWFASAYALFSGHGAARHRGRDVRAPLPSLPAPLPPGRGRGETPLLGPRHHPGNRVPLRPRWR